MKIVTSSEIKRIEGLAYGEGVTSDKLIENAGFAVAELIAKEHGHIQDAHVIALIGSGNNGADGLVACSYLAQWGAKVVASICRPRPAHDLFSDRSRAAGVDIIDISCNQVMEPLQNHCKKSDILIDAILGTGLSRPIGGFLRDLMQWVSDVASNRHYMKVYAVDLPSGINSDNGKMDQATIKSDMTIALGYPKIAHYTQPSSSAVGRLRVVDIGIPLGLDREVKVRSIDGKWAHDNLPDRPNNSHKGTFGRTMIVGGSINFVGAPVLAAAAAARVGSGLVTISGPRFVNDAVSCRLVEATLLPFAEDQYGVLEAWKSARRIIENLEGYKSMLIGCGLGMKHEANMFLHHLLQTKMELPPIVVDADGINLLAEFPYWWDRATNDMVLTPHVKEMSRLTKETISDISTFRLQIARSYAEKWSKIVVLKGANTIVANPDGVTWVSPFSNPVLSTAGTGDILSGMIAGLIAQGMDPGSAAALAVYLQGAAAESWSVAGGSSGMLASDLLTELPKTMNRIRDDS